VISSYELFFCSDAVRNKRSRLWTRYSTCVGRHRSHRYSLYWSYIAAIAYICQSRRIKIVHHNQIVISKILEKHGNMQYMSNFACSM